MLELKDLSAAEIGELVNSRVITPTEVLRYFEKRIIDNNFKINSFVYTKFDEAYKKAKELEGKLAKGEYCGPFAGVPFALKDFLPSKKGWTHSYGGVKCLVREDEYSSIFCESMEKLGGIAIGKCNAPAYGFRGTTDNKMYGPTSTPFNLKYNAGGSSGGSAAAVSAGLVPIAEGGDAGGSIRLPASFCNLFGFKASVGTIPNLCRPDGWSATHPFCMGGGLVKTVNDAAILLNEMSYYDSRDPYSIKKEIDYVEEIKNKRNFKIAYTKNFDLFEVDYKLLDNFNKVINKLKEKGFELEEVHFNFKNNLTELANQWCKGITIDCALELNHDKLNGKDYLKDNKDDFPEEFIYWKNICDNLTIEDMYKFNLTRTDVLDNFENIFDKYDLILSPISCCLPIENSDDGNTKGPEYINGKKLETLIGWSQTFLVNFIGYPAASIPGGLIDNMPFGIQIIGKKYKDEDVLNFSKQYEDLFPWLDYFKLIKEVK